jgi:ribosomal protein L40E
MSRETLGFVELEWTCPKCGNRNPGPEKTCLSCGAPQPEDIQFEQVQGKELVIDEEVKKQVEKGADIHCAFCGARNPADAKVCSQCGADLSEGKSRLKGRVVGAYKTTPAQKIICPNCGAENSETNLKCYQCGAPLTIQKEEPQIKTSLPEKPIQASPPSKKSSLLFVGLGLLVIILCVIALIAFIFLSSARESLQGIVQEVQWETSIELEELGPVTYRAWQNEVPLAARLGQCEDQLHHTQQNEPSDGNYEKICGTPYTIDTGTGQGQVVQDCEFEVYLPFCEYEIDEWQVIDTVKQSGSGYAITFPNPSLRTNQRLGEESESYVVIFDSSEGIYSYSVSHYDDFQRFQIGSEWILNINAFDQVVSVEPIQ